jgi:ribose-phosphate pyrophosphokinase
MKKNLVKTEIKRFSDRECYVRIIDSVDEDHVIIIQSTISDAHIIELFLLMDAVRREQAKKITCVIPYYGYARQDKQFQKGEAISSAALAALISTNADAVVTIDPHKEHILDYFSIPAESISAIMPLSSYLQKKEIDLVLAPDAGAMNRAKQAASYLNCEVDYLEKKRIDSSTVQITPKNLDATNKTVAIIDDIIATGGTMARSIEELHRQGAKEIYITCTHGLFAGNAIEKLQNTRPTEIIATDTIDSEYSKVSTDQIISNKLQKK